MRWITAVLRRFGWGSPYPMGLVVDGRTFTVETVGCGLLFATCDRIPAFIVFGQSLDELRAKIPAEMASHTARFGVPA